LADSAEALEGVGEGVPGVSKLILRHEAGGLFGDDLWGEVGDGAEAGGFEDAGVVGG